MERIRRLSIASEKYGIILDRLGNQKGESTAFVLLHNAYCLADLGERKEAIVLLKRVGIDFPNTHYSRTASQLLKIVTGREKIAHKIKSQNQNELQVAQTLYKAGIYVDSCQYYEKQIVALGGLDNYYFAYCSEDIGNVKRAIKLYKEFIQDSSSQGSNLARQANRRLLLLGKFYKGGQEAVETANKNASRLQDTVVLDKITQAAKKQKKSIVIEEIKEKVKQKGKESTPDLELYEEIGVELVTQANIEDKALIKLAEKKKEQDKLEAAKQAEEKTALIKKKQKAKRQAELAKAKQAGAKTALIKKKQKVKRQAELAKAKQAGAKTALIKKKQKVKRQAKLAKAKQAEEKIVRLKEKREKALALQEKRKESKQKFIRAKEEGLLYLSLQTRGGRKFRAEKVYFQKDKLLLKTQRISTMIPLSLIRKIVTVDERKIPTGDLMKLYTTKGNYKGNSILISAEQDRVQIGNNVFRQKEVKKVELVIARNNEDK